MNILNSSSWLCLIIFFCVINSQAIPRDYNGWIVGNDSLPRPTAGSAVAHNNALTTIYLLGGLGQTQALVEFDIATESFNDRNITYFTEPISSNAQFYTQYGNYLYLANTPGDTLFLFDTETQSIDYNFKTIPTAREDRACVTMLDIDDGYLAVIGGGNATHSLSTIEILNISSNQWLSNVPSLNTARKHLTCNSYQNKIYIISGHNEVLAYLNTIEVFDFITMQLNVLSNTLSVGSGGLRSIIYPPEIVIFGIPGASGKDINILNIITNEISTGSQTDVQLTWGPTAILINKKVYVFAGAARLTNLDTFRSVEPISQSPTPAPSTASNPPTIAPSQPPTSATDTPTYLPSNNPTNTPSNLPSNNPTDTPTYLPSNNPTNAPSIAPSNTPTYLPSNNPTNTPTNTPSERSAYPTMDPTYNPTIAPTNVPSETYNPTPYISEIPTNNPITKYPTYIPTEQPILESTQNEQSILVDIDISSDTLTMIVYAGIITCACMWIMIVYLKKRKKNKTDCTENNIEKQIEMTTTQIKYRNNDIINNTNNVMNLESNGIEIIERKYSDDIQQIDYENVKTKTPSDTIESKNNKIENEGNDIDVKIEKEKDNVVETNDVIFFKANRKWDKSDSEEESESDIDFEC